jgi:DNA-directed RNA polymerase specialized sigma24 family protein
MAAPADDESGAVLKAILALLIDERETKAAERPTQRKTEVVLADSGLSASEIAALMGKQPSAVRMAISRARKAKPSG